MFNKPLVLSLLFFLWAPGIFSGAFIFNAHADADDQRWLNLVHYKKNIWGHYLSQADGENFFLHPEGKKSPEKELARTKELFTQNNLDAICRFPARSIYLTQKNPLTLCKEYREFVEKLNPKSISLIFSSYFINSPASAFGHTFLRVNSSRHEDPESSKADLLDYGINYAAQMDSDNVLIYATKSMLGLFPGTFTAVPFYYKVREYNDFESRDLWEYQLQFTQEQIDLMVAHMWELGQTYFDYKFFTENCSYHILGILEVGNPQLKLTEALPPLYVIPVDTVRLLFTEKNLVRGFKFRPSVLTKLKYSTKDLNFTEKSNILSWVNDPQRMALDLKNQSPEQQAKFMDATLDAFDFINAQALVHDPKKVQETRHQLATERAMVDVVSNVSMPAPLHSPQTAHRSQRLGLNYGEMEGEKYARFQIRFALHDLLDPLPGQPQFSEIEFAGLNLRLQNEQDAQKLYLDRLDLFRVSSFEPVTAFQKDFSWTARLGLRNIQDRACVDCLAGHMELGGGASIAPEGSLSFVSLLSKLEIDYTGAFAGSGRVMVGPEVWARLAEWESVSMLLKSGYKWGTEFDQFNFGQGLFTHSLELRYHATQSSSMSLKGEVFDEHRQALEVGLLHFF